MKKRKTKKETQEILKTPTGNIPAKDKETYDVVVTSLINTWDIKRPPEIMLVNRMVSVWMKMRRIEQMLESYDVIFEQKDKSGNLEGVKINPLVHYLTALEKDFRSYYKVLQDTNSNLPEGPKDMFDFLNITEKSGNKETRSEED